MRRRAVAVGLSLLVSLLLSATVAGATPDDSNVGESVGGPDAADTVETAAATGSVVRHVVSDTTWRTSAAAPDGWERVGFDDAAWGSTFVVDRPYEATGLIPGTAASLFWGADRQLGPGGPYATHARKTFGLSTEVLSATVTFWASDDVTVFVNDRGFIDDNHVPGPVNTINVLDALTLGRNVIAVAGAEWGVEYEPALLFDLRLVLATAEDPRCDLTPDGGKLFEGRFWANPTAGPFPLPQPLGPGALQVVAVAGDADHRPRPGAVDAASQRSERFRVDLLDAAGAVVAPSAPTPDLGDREFVTPPTHLGPVEVTRPVFAYRLVHVGDGSSPNSITTGCVGVYLQPPGHVVHVVSNQLWKTASEAESPGFRWFAPGPFDDSGWHPAVADWPYTLPVASAMPGSSAHYLWHPDDPQVAYFRMTFPLPADPLTAVASIRVDDDFTLFVNGALASSDQDKTSGPTFTVDITRLLHAGTNLIAVFASDSFGGERSVLFDAAITLPASAEARCDDPRDLADLHGCDLSWAPLGAASLRGADMGNADLTAADLRQADLGTANLAGSRLVADLRGARLVAANVSNVSIGGRLDGADFSRATIQSVEMLGADATHAIFDGADIRAAYLSGNFAGASFRDVFGGGVRFPGSNLSGADFTSATMYEADFGPSVWPHPTRHRRPANLHDAVLAGATLPGAVFFGVTLSGADLEGADLRNADLRGADLSGADLSASKLDGANLRGAVLTEARLDGVSWAGATCPDGSAAATNPDGACTGTHGQPTGIRLTGTGQTTSVRAEASIQSTAIEEVLVGDVVLATGRTQSGAGPALVEIETVSTKGWVLAEFLTPWIAP